jgi:hypothetical protein
MQVRFTYKDGVHDGELNIFDGVKFESKDIVIFLLVEMGYEPKWIADSSLGMTEDSVKTTYALMRGYRNDLYKIKQRRAMGRLMSVVNKQNL